MPVLASEEPVLDSEAKSSSIILSHRFTDVDRLAEKIQPFCKVQVTQLSVDGLHCNVLAAAFCDVQFLFVKTSCPILAVGEKPKDTLIFGCLLETTGPCLISHQRRVSHHTMAGLDPDLDIKVVCPTGMQYASVYLKRDVLQQYLNLMERADLDERLWGSNYLHIPETISTVKPYLQEVLHLIQHQPHFLHRSDINTLLTEDFIPLLINAIPPATNDILQPPSPITKALLVKQAEEYMMAHLDQPLTLKDLCKVLHTSATPVFTGFQEVFGTSPMDYLKAQRLLAVRRSLQAATSETTSVMDIARKYGFWSGGHFSRDYKQMFGELPSETLKRV